LLPVKGQILHVWSRRGQVLTLNEKKDRDGKIGKVTFYCTEKESRGGKVLKI
jgi:hypothetical protein